MTDIVEVTDDGLVVVDNTTPVSIVRETNYQIVEVIGQGPQGPPGTPNPPSDGGDDLGTPALGWGKLYITSGGQVIFGNDVTMTHSADLLTIAGGVVEFSSRPTFSGSGILASSDIGATVQAWDADLDSWRAITRAAGFDTFVATPSVANLASLLTDEAAGFTNFLVTPSVANLMTFLTDDAAGLGTFMVTPSVANFMSLLTNDAAGLGDFMVTPSSANLRTLVTDETGTGVLVFGTSPTFTTSMLLSSGFVMSWNAGDVTLTHSADALTLAGGSLVLPAAGLTVGASIPFSDSAGVLTLQNVDALDATTEATIEAAIDTLANLTSIQGVSFTFGSYAATILNNTSELGFKQAVNLEIGVDVQAYDADLASWAGVTRASGFDTFVATPTLANFGSLLTNDPTGLITWMTTPSSANLAALLTDETGSGAAVFGTSPTFTTSMLLSSGFVFNWNASDLTLTHSLNTLTLTGGSLVLDAAGLTVGASIPFSDSAGVLTLQNVDALDATTEATIEAAIDTLANLTSIQGVSFTFGSYAATILNNTTELGFKQAVNLEIGVDVQAYDADLASWAGVTRASGFDTFAATPSLANFGALLNNDPTGLITFMTTPTSANLAALVTDETGSGALVFATSPTLVTPVLGAATGTSLSLSSGTGLTVGSSIPFSDAAGVLTLQNVDALDATTEATIEAAIDTLANLTSIQGVSFTFGSYAATLLNNTSEATFKAAVNLEIGVDVQAYDADLASWASVTRAAGFDTFVATPSSANLAALVTGETGSGALVFGTAPVVADPDFTGLVDVQQSFALTGDVTPPEITSDQNDYSPTGLSTASVLRLDTDTSRTITGLAGGSDGRILLIHNVGTTDLVLADESASSSAANRFALAAAVTLASDQSAMLQYDGTSQRWRMIGGTGSGGGGGGSGDVTAAANFGVDNRLIRSDGSLKGVQFAGILIDDSTFTMYPETNDSGSLGKASFGWADLYLAAGGLIYQNGREWKGGAKVSATAPTSPFDGELWYDTNDGTLMVYFNDGTSSQWAQVSAYAPAGVLTSADIGVTLQAYDADTAKLDAAANFTSTLQRGGSNVLVASDIGSTIANVPVRATVQATTTGTSRDFTGIPSWVNKIIVMLADVSTSGTSVALIQLGTGGVPTTTGYSAIVGTTTSTVGFPLPGTAGTQLRTGVLILHRINGDQWVCSGEIREAANSFNVCGYVTLSGTLDMIRLTTTNGTDVFDNGSINIRYEA